MQQAVQLKLSENKQWLSLLHIKDGDAQIIDSTFLLSSEKFSALAELKSTLSLIQKDKQKAFCRYPARYTFLNHYLSFGPSTQELVASCTELSNYLKFVPFNHLELVYSSEVLSSASSMMGHTFLKVSGKNHKQNDVSHSISFFTEIKTFNPLSLIYQGTISGMPGFFLVRPYEIDHEQYSKKEGRNIWSYSIELSEFNRQLIQLHIWELKEVQIEYLFQNFNCATLTLDILSLANPQLLQEEKLFVSPIDVVKAVNKNGMVKKQKVTLSAEWNLSMLQQQLSRALQLEIESFVFNNTELLFSDKTEAEKLLTIEYINALMYKYEVEESLVTSRLIGYNTELLNNDSRILIDLTNYKNPINTPQDSIISASIFYRDDQSFIDLEFLPASHYLTSDNSQYFSESELVIGKLSLRKSLTSNLLKLNEFTLYSVTSLIPSTRLQPQLSGAFYLGYKRIFTEKKQDAGSFQLSGSFGKTYRLGKDVIAYAMLGFGGALTSADKYFYSEPYIGIMVNLIGDIKGSVEYKKNLPINASSKILNSITGSLTWLGKRNIAISLLMKKEEIRSLQLNSIALKYDYHF